MKLGNQFEKIMGGLNIDWNGDDRDDPAGPPALAEPGPRRARESRGGWSWRPTWPSGRSSTSSTCKCSASAARWRRTPVWPTIRAYKWQELARFDYTPADCVTFHDAIEHEVVPLARKIYAEQANRAGTGHAPALGHRRRPARRAAAAVQGGRRSGRGLQPHLQPGGSGAGRALRRHARRLPRPALARQQGARRLLRGVPGDRQTLHLHERRRHA